MKNIRFARPSYLITPLIKTSRKTSIGQPCLLAGGNYVDEFFHRVPVLTHPDVQGKTVQTKRIQTSEINFIYQKVYPSGCSKLDNKSTYELAKEDLCSGEAA